MTPSLITLLVTAGLQYGPEFVTSIISILKNPNATVADVEAAFANLKPYSAYNIPVPSAPVSVSASATPPVSS
jgi:hypothetical protein